MENLDVAWLETGANQQGPELARVIVHLVVIHLFGRT